MIESLIEEDDVIMDDVIEKTNKLSDLTDGITNYFGRPEYNTSRETMLGDMCHFLDDTIQEAVVTMTTKACHVSLSILTYFNTLIRENRSCLAELI